MAGLADVKVALLTDSPWLIGVMAAYDAGLRRHAAGQHPSSYPFSSFDGVRLTAEYRALLFKTGSLNRRTLAFQSIRFRGYLRLFKRQILRLASLFSNRAPASRAT